MLYYFEKDLVMSMSKVEQQYSIFDRQADIERFKQVVHDGWRSQLPTAEITGFEPVVFANSVNMDDAVDIANTSYDDLPPGYKDTLSSTTAFLTSFLMRLSKDKRPLDTTAVDEGKQLINRGRLHAEFGNTLGSYVDETGSEDSLKLKIVTSRLQNYDKLVGSEERKIDEAIICTGALAFTRPDIFRWVDHHSGGYDMRLIPGITGTTTPLQEMLLSEPPQKPVAEREAINPGYYFVSFTAKGLPKEELEPNLRAIIDGLHERKEKTYCTYFLDESDYLEFNPNDFVDFMNNAFRRIKAARALICLVASPAIGDGLQQELSCAKNTDIPIVMANHTSAKDHSLVRMADYAFTYETPEDLRHAIDAMPQEIPIVTSPTHSPQTTESEPVWRQYMND
jgi:hypothetical protein